MNLYLKPANSPASAASRCSRCSIVAASPCSTRTTSMPTRGGGLPRFSSAGLSLQASHECEKLNELLAHSTRHVHWGQAVAIGHDLGLEKQSKCPGYLQTPLYFLKDRRPKL